MIKKNFLWKTPIELADKEEIKKLFDTKNHK